MNGETLICAYLKMPKKLLKENSVIYTRVWLFPMKNRPLDENFAKEINIYLI